jgi:phenylacetic acid degradation operon negative regulatory protein
MARAFDLNPLIDIAPLRAAAFIVTIYGDVVAPRGGEAAVGNLIDICAEVGISETLVRTAVSRLVAGGQLSGRREGRRSFYCLTPEAALEYDRAAAVIYGAARNCDWRFVFLPEASAEQVMPLMERQGYARIRPQLAVGPDHLPVPEGALAFRATLAQAGAALREFGAAFWDLSPLATDYAAFNTAFAPLAQGQAMDGPWALVARLLLVHRFRRLVLRDPGLPEAALPLGWQGAQARLVHARAYLAISAAAEAEVARRFESADGPLPAHSDESRIRLARLAGIVSQNSGQ